MEQQRVFQLYFQFLFLRKAARGIFPVQPPLFHKGADIRRRYPHAEIYHQPLAAGVGGRNLVRDSAARQVSAEGKRREIVMASTMAKANP